MSLIFTIVVAILNFIAAIIEWVSIEREIKLQYLILSSKKKESSKKKRTTRCRQAKR
ncbi:MAG: hypothetical protein K2K48_02325 [Anaeroplasmataceae bacterium]|nr:hypothetical protein [Anaeroplasmataceae bacterium]